MSVGFIGCGNMGSALAKAVCESCGKETVLVANRTSAKAEALAQKLGCTPSDNQYIGQHSDWIFLGVKPQMMGDMLADLQATLANRERPAVLVSMAAGLTTSRIQEMAGGNYPVIRILPNTPVEVGCGVIQYCGSPEVTAGQLDALAQMLAPGGLVDLVDEKLIDASSAVSGCGPAFAYLFMEALADGGVACGLPRQKAMAYAAQMVQGAATLVLESQEHPGVLKDKVCSPGGATIQGVRALEAGGFRSATMEAVIKAYLKHGDLGKN